MSFELELDDDSEDILDKVNIELSKSDVPARFKIDNNICSLIKINKKK